MTQEPSVQDCREMAGDAVARPKRVQAAFEVWRNHPETGPNASALFQYIEQLEARLAGTLYGPYGWLNGHRGLSEDSWTIEGDPLENNEEYFAVPLYALADPFKEIGKDSPAAAAPPPATSSAVEALRDDFEKAFQLVFEAYSTPADRFEDVHNCLIFKTGKITKAFSILQKIRAALQAGTEVAVKALEWKPAALEREYGWLIVAIAETPFGQYTVEKNDENVFRVVLTGQVVNGLARTEKAAAKAAAQADYESRIRSALAPVQQAGVESELVEPKYDWDAMELFGFVDKAQQLFASAATHGDRFLREKGWTPVYSAASLSQLQQRIAEVERELEGWTTWAEGLSPAELSNGMNNLKAAKEAAEAALKAKDAKLAEALTDEQICQTIAWAFDCDDSFGMFNGEFLEVDGKQSIEKIAIGLKVARDRARSFTYSIQEKGNGSDSEVGK